MNRAPSEQFLLQSIFDRVGNHLLTQNERAWHADLGCRYRTDHGLSCAVGCLFDDMPEAQACELEGDVFLVRRHLEERGYYGDDVLELLRKLQGVHDNVPRREWRDTLRNVAWKFDLCVTNLMQQPAPPSG